MDRRRLVGVGIAVAATVVVLAASGCDDDAGPAKASAESTALAPIAIGDAWARATVAAATTGAVYLDLAAADDDELIGAAVGDDVAAAVTLHESITGGTGGHQDHGDGGMVTMTELDALALPAGEPVALHPGGTHLMLVDLARPLVAGATFEITLRFATADDLTIVVEVRPDP